MRFLYTLLFYLILPVVLCRTLWRTRKTNEKGRIFERLGFVPTLSRQGKTIWLHAVSVGEFFAARPLIEGLLKEYPDHVLVVTTTTQTAAKQVQQQLHDRVRHLYFPYDVPGAVKRFLRAIRPTVVIVMETELWPNLFFYLKRYRVPVLLANARLSQQSCHRYAKISSLIRHTVSAITCLAAQSELDANRFLKLGASMGQLQVLGNIKFDLAIPPHLHSQAEALKVSFEGRPTFIAASTHEGEEIIVLKAFTRIRQTFPNALLILVPRHIHRAPAIVELCHKYGFDTVLRSEGRAPSEATGVLLGDTMGELLLLYAASRVAFVGGSLVPRGGHNLIEPAAVRVSIITGPYLHNFKHVYQLLSQANALLVVDDELGLAEAVMCLFKEADKAQLMQERAYQVSIANVGAVEKHMQWLRGILNSQALRSPFNASQRVRMHHS